MNEVIRKQIELEEDLRKELEKNSNSKKFQEVYDKYHEYILKYGYPREGRKVDGVLYSKRTYKSPVVDTIIKLSGRNKKILEIGVGDGNLSYKLAKNKNEVVGIDISKIALEHAKKNLDENKKLKLSYKYGDARELPFSDNMFDIVISKDVIEHLPEINHLDHFYEVKRVLKKGSVYIFYTPPPKLPQGNIEGLHLKEYTLCELLQFLNPLFSKIDIYNVQLMAFGILFKIPQKLIRIIGLYEHLLYLLKFPMLLKFNKIFIFRGVFRVEK